jgi:hypothetical protein
MTLAEVNATAMVHPQYACFETRCCTPLLSMTEDIR